MKPQQTRGTTQSFEGTGPAGRSRKARRRRPNLESLETRQVLSTFAVNTTADSVAVDLQTGKDATGHISLRSAIMAANAHAGADSITLPTGLFQLSIAGANEDNTATGDLDIKSDLTIDGTGNSVIDGNSLDRVFEILSGNVRISGVTIKGGLSSTGGGLLNVAGNVTLSNDTISNNTAIGSAGLNGSSGNATRVGGSPGGNGGDAFGAGVDNVGGSLTIANSLITGNVARGARAGAAAQASA
ncbi:hypothetical protein [Singulisphaera sp. PoT]|uniref:hypothetical protein n=1 Tax=Singulisphaera sp. PoT TaxID=3411797 RepID=UPI003BF511A1